MTTTSSRGLAKRFLDNADTEVRSAVRSRSVTSIVERIQCARTLLKLALEEYQKELEPDGDIQPKSGT